MRDFARFWRSFRFRLAMLTLVSVLGVMLVYSVALYLRLDQEMTERFEHRLRLHATQLPMTPPNDEGERWEAPRRGRFREFLESRAVMARWSPERGWIPLFGEWPEQVKESLAHEAMVSRARKWKEVKLPAKPDVPAFPDLAAWPPDIDPPPPPGVPRKQVYKMEFGEVKVENSEWLVGGLRLPGGDLLWLGQNLDRERAALRDLVRAQSRLAPLLLLVVLVVSWILATRALRPVRALRSAMARISERNLSERLVDRDAAAEFQELIEVFNGMLARLERSFQQASRFSADASHELRTPLTVLQGELEAAVQQAEAGSSEQRQFSSLLEEVQRLRVMTDRLLQLAHADAGRLVQRREVVDLRELAETQVELLRELAPRLTVEAALEPARVQGDSGLLRQAIMNLLSNAQKYNREEGFVRVELISDEGVVNIRVSNSGPPIPLEIRTRIFDRFYRGDAARNRAVEGLGLGLSLAREIARAHGGDLSLRATTADATVFELTLPALAEEG